MKLYVTPDEFLAIMRTEREYQLRPGLYINRNPDTDPMYQCIKNLCGEDIAKRCSFREDSTELVVTKTPPENRLEE